MCGILGILHDASVQLDPAVLEAASKVQAHRGPDSRRIQTLRFARSSLVLAHQRLSIIDLTEAGLQPMAYNNGRGTLIYNGELYNYLELRDELALAGERFATRSDTEVLLAALHHWGPEGALSRFNWMGAFAWVDRTAEDSSWRVTQGRRSRSTTTATITSSPLRRKSRRCSRC